MRKKIPLHKYLGKHPGKIPIELGPHASVFYSRGRKFIKKIKLVQYDVVLGTVPVGELIAAMFLSIPQTCDTCHSIWPELLPICTQEVFITCSAKRRY